MPTLRGPVSFDDMRSHSRNQVQDSAGRNSRQSMQSGRSSLFNQLSTDKLCTIRRIREFLIILGLLVPVSILIALFTNTVSQYFALSNVQDNMDKTQKVSSLLSFMQKERGTSCMFVESPMNASTGVAETLFKMRSGTDSSLITLGLAFGADFFTPEEAAELSNDRKRILERTMDCFEILETFTARHEKVLWRLEHERSKSEEANLWSSLSRYNLMLFAQDTVGVARAMGATYFASGQFTSSALARFNSAFGTGQNLLNIALGPVKELKALLVNTMKERGVDESLQIYLQLIRKNEKINADSIRASYWFQNMTGYISIIESTKNQLFENIQDIVTRRLTDTMLSILLTVFCAGFALLVTPTITLYYLFSNGKLLDRIRSTIENLKTKTKDLNEERQKTDILLNQMLPKAVVEALKVNGVFPPESYDSVTIYFSDVVGFTSLSSKSTPMEIINLLNYLYSSFDRILDQYDVYKVETIGDAYMVASGLPIRNGGKHSSEICTVALDILRTMDKFHIPHYNNEKLFIRVGCHTGACAAGVVGLKMPRYCLFGDTVNTASRMESSGKAGTCQISEETKNALDMFRIFQVTLRGEMEIKGKGQVRTYWLVGKSGFPFTVDVEKIAEDFALQTYYKHASECKNTVTDL